MSVEAGSLLDELTIDGVLHLPFNSYRDGLIHFIALHHPDPCFAQISFNHCISFINDLCFYGRFFGQGRLQTGDILPQRTDAHRILQRGDGMRELQLLQPLLILLYPGLQVVLIEILQAIQEIDLL